MTLPLDTFRSVLGYNPFHFWGLANSKVPITSACNSWVKEYAWQNADAAGRVDIRHAILSAESRLREYLGFNVGVHFVEEVINYPRLPNPGMWRYNFPIDARGLRVAVQLPEGEILAMGVETHTALDLAAAVVLTDRDSDGLTDTFTLTVDITGLTITADEVAVYFPASERLDGQPIGERWLIAPLQINISGNTLTIIGRSWLIVRPILYEGAKPQPIDPDDDSNYADTLEVYRRYAEPNGLTTDDSQAVLIWETLSGASCARACNGLSFASGYSDPSAEGYALARAGLRDAARGWIHPGETVLNTDGTWSEIKWSGCRAPERVLARYQAGIKYQRTDSLQAGSSWEMIITRLTAAEMMRPICGCDEANQELYRWQFDLSRSAGANDEQYSISQEDLNNPLGRRAGAVYAWKQIKNLRQTRAHLA